MTAARRINCTGVNRLARDRWNRRRNTMAIFFGHRRCNSGDRLCQDELELLPRSGY
jgi:hypothetical protein